MRTLRPPPSRDTTRRLGLLLRRLTVSALFATLLAPATSCDERGAATAPTSPDGAPPAAAASSASPSRGAGSASASAPSKTDADAELAFVREGRTVRTLRLSELRRALPVEQWTAFDPYYGRPKTYRAIPFASLLRHGFAGETGLEEQEFVLRARDGFTVPLLGQKLFEPGGYLAIEDVDFADWEPIGPQRANPGPYYLVWRHADQQKLETHPRPWQLASIEIARFESTFPHTAPTGVAPSSPAARGFAIFKQQCILCHAINRQGGRVGPDLNVPMSIVEYRPERQIKDYIRDPRRFRYGAMPAHPHLSDGDLDALVAYFRAMKDRKHDSEAGSKGH